MTMYDVFISYRRSDGSALAESLAKYLRSKGLRVFFDRNEIKDSQDFKDRIETSLRQAPNYLLIASTAAFQFYTDQEDWVKREMEIACENYDGNTGSGRVITVVAPNGAIVPREEEMPEKIRVLANPNRIMLRGELPADDEKLRVLKVVTAVNRHNLWNAGHRWLEESKKPGARFSALDINASLFPNAAKREAEPRGRRKFPIYVQSASHLSKERKPLMQALAENTDHIYLIGQGGIGKTTTLVHLMNEAYGTGKNYEENCQIPLFVSLSAAPDTYGALYEGGRSTYIRRAIYKQVREDRTVKKVTKQEVAKLDEAFTVDPETAVEPVVDLLSKQTAAPEYLLLLDGLNEVSRNQIEEAGRSVIQMILREINWLITECPNVRLIITGRADEAMIHGERLIRLALSGLKKATIRQYLSDSECSEEKITRVFQNDALLETLSIPLFLVMYANLRENDEVSTQGEILRIFFSEHKNSLQIYTAQDRLSQVEDDVENAASAVQKLRITAEMQCFMLDFLLPEIAWYMEQRDLFALDEESIADVIEPVLTGREDTDVCGRYGKQVFTKYCSSGSAKTHTRKTAKDILTRLGSDMEEVTESFIDCCIFSLGILSTNGGKYGFVHQHIRDYFAAQKVINQLWLAVCLYDSGQDDTAYECLSTVLYDKPLRLTLRRFIGEALGEYKNKPQFIDGKWRYMVPEELCGESLIRHSFNILRGRPCNQDYMLNNLIHIVNEVRTELSGEDLSSLDFSNCSLNRKRLSRLDLAASLHNAVIHGQTLFSNVHTDLIRAGSFSPEPGLFITVSRDGTMKLWNIETGECVRTISAHKDGVSEYHHQASRSLAVTAGNDAIKFWNDASFDLITTIPIPEDERFRRSAMCPDGKYYTYLTKAKNGSESYTIRILDVDKIECVGQIPFEKGYLRNAVLCENTRYIIMEYCTEISSSPGMREYFYELYDRETGSWTDLNGYKDRGELAVCENIGYLAIQNTGKLRLEDPVSKTTVMEVDAGSKLLQLSVSEEGVLFAVTRNDEAQFWDITSGSVIAKCKASGFHPFKGTIHKKESQYAVFDGSVLRIYNYTSEKLLCQISSFWLRVQSASFSKDAEKIVISSGNEAVQIWEREAGQYRCRTMVMHDSGDFMFAYWTKDDAHCLVTYVTKNRKKRIRHYNVVTNQLLQSKDMSNAKDFWYCPDGHTLFVERKDKKSLGKETVIEQYDLETMELLQTWAFPGDHSVGCIRPDGKYFVMFYKRDRRAQKHIARVYDVQGQCFAGEIVAEEFIGEYRYSPDGERLIATGERKLYVYDSRTCEYLRELSGSEALSHTFDIRCDDSQMANALSGVVHIWDMNTMEVVKSLPHPQSWITLVEYSPNGQKLITATANGTVFIWDANTYECIQTIPNVPGVFAQGVDLRSLAPESDITEDGKQILGMYGAVVD